MNILDTISDSLFINVNLYNHSGYLVSTLIDTLHYSEFDGMNSIELYFSDDYLSHGLELNLFRTPSSNTLQVKQLKCY